MGDPDANIGPIKFLERFAGQDLAALKDFIWKKIKRQRRLSFNPPEDTRNLRGDWRWKTMFEDGTDLVHSNNKVYVVMRMRPKSDHGFTENETYWYVGLNDEKNLMRKLSDVICSDDFDMDLVDAKGWKQRIELVTQLDNSHPYTVEFVIEITD